MVAFARSRAYLTAMSNEPASLADFGWSEHFQAQLAPADATALPVRVVAEHRDGLEAIGPSFEGRIQALTSDTGERDRATVGDWVLIDAASHRPLKLLARRNVFKRKSAGKDRGVQLIAANIDTLIIVTSANQEFNTARLERYLALARGTDVRAAVVITKSDLSADIEPFVREARALMDGLAVEAIDARGADAARVLAPWLGRGQTLALLGSSGVGKSTLVNALLGYEEQTTQAVRGDDAKGRHTTSGRSLHRLSTGAWLMDTPGIRELQLIDVEGGIADLFDDITALAQQCKFKTCSHGTEPGCAVQAALASGELEPARFARYRKLQGEERRNERLVDEARARGRGKRYGKSARKTAAERMDRGDG
jgi:ribosome biogenesis GTPase